MSAVADRSADQSSLETPRRVRILGVEIDDLGFDDAIARLRAFAVEPVRRSVFFANANTIEIASRSAPFLDILNEANAVFGDGTGVRWAARLQGIRLRANLNGTDLIPAFLQAADADRLRCYLLGAVPAVIERAADVVSRRFPGWTLVGHHHGFLDAEATERVVAEINAVRPNVLLVGMGNPIQEEWIAANRDRLDVNLVVGVGALFAYLTGDSRRAPPAMRRAGLEWLAVLFTQRHKWRRYVVGAPTFLIRVLGERMFGPRAS